MKGLGGGRLGSIEVDGFYRKSILGLCLVVLMDLEAQTLSELRYVYSLSIYIGFGSRFYWDYGFVGQGRVDVWRFCSGKIDWEIDIFRPARNGDGPDRTPLLLRTRFWSSDFAQIVDLFMLSPRFARQKKSISQPICSATISSKFDPSLAKKSIFLTNQLLKLIWAGRA